MLLNTLLVFFVGLAAAVPTTNTNTQPSYPKCSNQKDPVFVVYQLLKLSPLGQKWCKAKIAPVTQTITVGAVQTAKTTETALNVVTIAGGIGGTTTVTAPVETVVQTQTAMATTTVTSSVCPDPISPMPTKRANGDCPNSPILGWACETLEYACHCLNLPTSTIKKTVTTTATTLVSTTTTVVSTTAIPATVMTTPTITNTVTVTSTSTLCTVAAPPPVNMCDNPTSCNNVNYCTGSSDCICLTGSDGVNMCGNIAVDQGCGVQKPCDVNADCNPTEICITACCSTKICYATEGCPNTASTRRMFRKDASLVQKRRGLPPSFDPSAAGAL